MVILTEIGQNRWILGPEAVNPGSGGTGTAGAVERRCGRRGHDTGLGGAAPHGRGRNRARAAKCGLERHGMGAAEIELERHGTGAAEIELESQTLRRKR